MFLNHTLAGLLAQNITKHQTHRSDETFFSKCLKNASHLGLLVDLTHFVMFI